MIAPVEAMPTDGLSSRRPRSQTSAPGENTMHTILVILGGFVLMALCLLGGRIFGGPGAASLITGLKLFLPLWLLGAGINMYIGVARAGYSVGEELPIFLLIYAVPAAVAGLLWWRLARA
jgi:hypothetical protein